MERDQSQLAFDIFDDTALLLPALRVEGIDAWPTFGRDTGSIYAYSSSTARRCDCISRHR
jgi:hypothetical protein